MSSQNFNLDITKITDCGSSLSVSPTKNTVRPSQLPIAGDGRLINSLYSEPSLAEESRPGICPLTLDNLVLAEVANHGYQLEEQTFTGEQHSPTAQFPPELLCKVFHHLCNAWPTVYYCAEDNTAALMKLEWAVVTHVCRRWRVVAHSMPSLWTHIDLLLPEWGALLLERSRNLPISVKVPPDITAAGQELLVDVILKPGHLKDLSISLQNDIEFLEDFIELGLHNILAPSLESLVLFDMSPKPISLDGIMQQGAPHLQRLQVEPYMLPWTHPLLNNLTTLQLKIRDSQADTGLPWEFLDALDRMRGLEHLTLHHCIPSTLNEFTNDRVIELHHLVFLEVLARPSDCEGVLKHIAFPSTAFIMVTCSYTAALDPSIYVPSLITSLNSAWFPVNQPLVSRSHDSTSRGIPTITSLGISEYRFDSWQDGNIFGPVLNRFVFHPLLPDIPLDRPDPIWATNFDETPSLILDILKLFPLHSLVTLSIECPISQEALVIVGCIPSLQRIALTAESVDVFVAYVSQEDSLIRDESRSPSASPRGQSDHSLPFGPTCFASVNSIYLLGENHTLAVVERKIRPFLNLRLSYKQTISLHTHLPHDPDGLPF